MEKIMNILNHIPESKEALFLARIDVRLPVREVLAYE
jgi:hypothetical protein